jgi:hypothetical protein
MVPGDVEFECWTQIWKRFRFHKLVFSLSFVLAHNLINSSVEYIQFFSSCLLLSVDPHTHPFFHLFPFSFVFSFFFIFSFLFFLFPSLVTLICVVSPSAVPCLILLQVPFTLFSIILLSFDPYPFTIIVLI